MYISRAGNDTAFNRALLIDGSKVGKDAGHEDSLESRRNYRGRNYFDDFAGLIPLTVPLGVAGWKVR